MTLTLGFLVHGVCLELKNQKEDAIDQYVMARRMSRLVQTIES
jgi:hypothetical protein